MRTIFVNISFLTLLIPLALSGQTHPDSTRVRKETCSSDVRAEFVRTGTRPSIYVGESNDRIWLRFVNRTRRTILKIDAEDSQLTRHFLRQRSAELGVYYEVVRKTDCDSADEVIDERPVGYTKREAFHTVYLKPGKSFVFSVAKEHLSAGRSAYLTYECFKHCDSIDGTKKAYFFRAQKASSGR